MPICKVNSCTNEKHQGFFWGNVCVPCYQLAKDISRGKLDHSYNFAPGVVQDIANGWEQIIEDNKTVEFKE